MVRQVQPLRISKSGATPSSSPNKMAAARPLAEIGSTSQRRNSPSYNQATRKMIVSRESSPFANTENSSPFTKETSPRAFWSPRENMSPFRFDENTPDRSPSPAISSPRRRPSVERLKQASRVKNSNIFALETKDAYDPTSLPIVERPTTNRPLSQQFVNNSFTRFDSQKKENNPLRSPQRPGHKRSETEINIPTLSPTKEAATVPLPASPEKQYANMSPTKSSMARMSMFGAASPQSIFDPESGTWSDDERAPTPRALHRHNKSVTFHADPPVVTEYEQQTPEPSVSQGSRDGSWDPEDYEDGDISFDRGSSIEIPDREDSFDEDLENTDKTPVVLPEDWRRMSPDEARTDLVNNEDDVFDGSPSPQRPVLGRSESVASDGSSRPLPPLPSFMTEHKRRDSGGLAAAAERASLAARNLPSPPKRASCSKDDIMKMVRDSSLTFHERLELLGGHAEQDDRPTAGSSASTERGAEDSMIVTNLDTGEKNNIQVRVAEAPVEDEEDDSIGDLADLGDAPPRISRESILRKVRGTKYDFEDEDDDIDESVFADSPARPTYEELARMDPDQPIPSRENSRETSDHYLPRRSPIHREEYEEEVKIKDEPVDDDEVDLNAIPAVDEQQLQPPRSPSRMEDYERQSSVLHHQIRAESSEKEDEDDNSSRYSSVEPELESTMLHAQHHPEVDDGKETLDDAMQLLTVRDFTEALAQPEEQKQTSNAGDFMGLPTYLNYTETMAQPQEPPKQTSSGGDFMGLPAYLSTDDFGFGMQQYITPSPPASSENTQKLDTTKIPDLAPPAKVREPADMHAAPYSGPEVSPPGTPDSVVHNRSSDVSSLDTQDMQHEEAHEEERYPEPELPEIPDEPAIPERRSTIKTGGRLKARPSVTPADFESMAHQRRLVSSEHPMPAIPAVYQPEPESADAEEGSVYFSEGTESTKVDSLVEEEKPAKRRQSRKMTLEMPQLSTSVADDLGLGLTAEFDKVIENQKVGNPYPPPLFARFDAPQDNIYPPHYTSAKADGLPTPYGPHNRSAGANVYTRSQKGYLMRQNTKVVVASNRNFSGDSSGTMKSNDSSAAPVSPTFDRRPSSVKRGAASPRKPSAEQFLKTEPWNGKTRRKSVRNASAQKAQSAPAPPLPGQESALGVVEEDFAAGTSSLEDEVAEGVERGRLFVKVVGVKNLELPMPRNDRIYFQLTLDNGLHCVTTTSLELGKSAPIGQEFELVVLNDLEFQLTLTTKLPPPPAAPTPVPSSPTKSVKSQKQSGLSRFLTSPKKRAERERQEREAAEAEERRAQEEAQRKRAARQPTTWDLLHELVNAADGSFARAYVNLNAHEKQCFGRQLTVDVPCYNEWALEKNSHVINSVRSKRGTHAGLIRRPPYVVGKLELQLLYVPKPKGAGDEDMPKSMGSAVRAMAGVSEVKEEVVHEGHLSQQGGDCAHWRRRFFRLQGSKLTAYHEHTHQKRAVINLTKASRVVDDKRTLVADPTSGNPSSKGRRKSAFAEEDEGYQYVEEGFRIRFANGETIDFYADSRAHKDVWMEMLSQVMGKADVEKKAATWTDLVLAREKAEGASSPSVGSSSPVKAGGTEVKDFTKPPPPPARRQSDRRALPAREPSRSTPTSPLKGPPRQQPPPPSRTSVVEAAPPIRARTPPMNVRSGHRSRDAVKSMIF